MEDTEQKKLDNALISACDTTSSTLEEIKKLVNLGANIHAQQNSALRNSATHERLDFIEFLCQRGANIYAFHNVILNQSCFSGRLNSLKALIEHSTTPFNDKLLPYLITLSLQYGHLPVAKYLFGLDKTNLQEEKLNEFLIMISRHGYLDIAKFLIENGADPHAKNDTPMNNAIIYENLNIVQYLVVEHACDPRLVLDIAQEYLLSDISTWAKEYIEKKEMHDNLNNDLQKLKTKPQNKNKI